MEWAVIVALLWWFPRMWVAFKCVHITIESIVFLFASLLPFVFRSFQKLVIVVFIVSFFWLERENVMIAMLVPLPPHSAEIEAEREKGISFLFSFLWIYGDVNLVGPLTFRAWSICHFYWFHLCTHKHRREHLFFSGYWTRRLESIISSQWHQIRIRHRIIAKFCFRPWKSLHGKFGCLADVDLSYALPAWANYEC